MPRPNPLRTIYSERNLARRIAAERDARGWTNDGLAKRMSEAGCPMAGSAIFKIEKGDPPRRIVVDELTAFARVFNLEVADLLLPPEVAVDAEVRSLVTGLATAHRATEAAIADEQEAMARAVAFLTKHPEIGAGAPIGDILQELVSAELVR